MQILFSFYEDTVLWLLQTPSDKYLVEEAASWINSVPCEFTAFRAGWRLLCSVKYMDIKHCISLDSYPRCTSSVVNPRHFPHCARCPLAALSLWLSDVYEEQLFTLLFGEERAQLPSCHCQARHSFKRGQQYVRELMHFWSYLCSHWGATFTNSSTSTLSIIAHRFIHKSWWFHVNNAPSGRTHKDLLSPQRCFCMNYKLYAYIAVIHCCQVIWEVCPLSLTYEIWIQKGIALERAHKEQESHVMGVLWMRACGVRVMDILKITQCRWNWSVGFSSSVFWYLGHFKLRSKFKIPLEKLTFPLFTVIQLSTSNTAKWQETEMILLFEKLYLT